MIMKYFFILFKKRSEEKSNAYSLINEQILNDVPKNIIKATKEVPNKLYTKDELRAFVQELGGIFYAS